MKMSSFPLSQILITSWRSWSYGFIQLRGSSNPWCSQLKETETSQEFQPLVLTPLFWIEFWLQHRTRDLFQSGNDLKMGVFFTEAQGWLWVSLKSLEISKAKFISMMCRTEITCGKKESLSRCHCLDARLPPLTKNQLNVSDTAMKKKEWSKLCSLSNGSRINSTTTWICLRISLRKKFSSQTVWISS